MAVDNKPKVRFEGFEGEWELTTVSNISDDAIGGGTPKTSIDRYWSGKIPWFQSSDLKQDAVLAVQANKRISAEAIDNSATKLIPKDSIAIVTRVGVGKLGLIPFEFSTSQDFISLVNLTINPLFGVFSLYRLIQKEMNNIQGTSIKGMTKVDLLGKKVSIPLSSQEQEQIGTLFELMDERIRLHKERKARMEEAKKSYMQKMFPKGAAKEPEMRFGDFEGEWKKKILGSVLEEYSEKTTVENQHLLLSSTNNGIEPREGRVSGSSNIGYKILNKDCVVLSPQNLWLGNINVNTEYNIGIVSPSYKTFKINQNIDFVNNYLRRTEMFNEYELVSLQGASVVRRTLELELFKQIVVKIPSLPEQQRIGAFFKAFDDRIQLETTAIEQAEQMKKFLLQKMFV